MWSPRFRASPLRNSPSAEALLSTSMKSVGEAMAVGRNFTESLQKALRSMETGLNGLNEVEIPRPEESEPLDDDAVRARAGRSVTRPLLVVAQAFRHGLELEDICPRLPF